MDMSLIENDKPIYRYIVVPCAIYHIAANDLPLYLILSRFEVELSRDELLKLLSSSRKAFGGWHVYMNSVASCNFMTVIE